MTPRRASLTVALSAALALETACSAGTGYDNGYGNVTVDGSDTSRVGRLPPVGYECYPRYRVRDGYVYDVHGHYYKEHNGDWSVVRSAPTEVRYEQPAVSDARHCFEYPP